jgi:hypothetical protein
MPFFFCYYILAGSEANFRALADLSRFYRSMFETALSHRSTRVLLGDHDDNVAGAVLLAMSKPRLSLLNGGKI